MVYARWSIKQVQSIGEEAKNGTVGLAEDRKRSSGAWAETVLVLGRISKERGKTDSGKW